MESGQLIGAATRAPRSFRICKWYLDAVGEDGRAFLGYCGTLAWAGVSFSYASALVVSKHGSSMTRVSTKRGSGPRENGDVISWASRGTGVDGSWRRLAAPVSRRLLDGPTGRIEWDCRAPQAQVRLALSDGTILHGFGYVERLVMTVAPWKLPVEELRWGRFHAESLFLLWIDWRGPQPLTLVVRDGVEEHGATVDDEIVSLSNETKLSLRQVRTLREGTAVPRALAAILPPRLRQWHESKWLSHGVLVERGRDPVPGWAVHERVDLRGASR